jgi:site-specific DNA-methyltransferase (adenine-specific)
MSNSYTSLYNPDVLSTLANLSSDEVFTPPHIVNQMLDMLPQELFKNKKTTFLDPATKSGIFLREIAKRLLVGLEEEIPNLQDRIDHIFHNQLYGIAITEMTSLLSRRSVYCSKYPNSKYSISLFDNPEGNIRFKKTNHIWDQKKCSICGANKSEYDRAIELENYAYEFIHSVPKEYQLMKFDVIIGNPPYQLSDGGAGSSAVPIYHKFIEQAKKLKPRYLSMIIPARWYAGGRGLDSFRKEMLNDRSIRILHDYPKASDCFPGVEIKGGVCFFLWDRDNKGECQILTHEGNKITNVSNRSLLEVGMETFIRDDRQIRILEKVNILKEEKFIEMVSANDPFGFDVREENSYKRIKAKYELKPFKNSVKLYYYGWQKNGIGHINKENIRKGNHLITKVKVYITRAYGAGDDFPHQIINKPFIGDQNSVCTETYTLIGPFDDSIQAKNCISYINTRFFRFLVSLIKNTQSAAKKVYSLVPIQNFNQEWDDTKLYKKYSITPDEIQYIESLIRPMAEVEEIEEEENGI